MSAKTAMCKAHILANEVIGLEKELQHLLQKDRAMLEKILEAYDAVKRLERYLDDYEERKMLAVEIGRVVNDASAGGVNAK